MPAEKHKSHYQQQQQQQWGGRGGRSPHRRSYRDNGLADDDGGSGDRDGRHHRGPHRRIDYHGGRSSNGAVGRHYNRHGWRREGSRDRRDAHMRRRHEDGYSSDGNASVSDHDGAPGGSYNNNNNDDSSREGRRHRHKRQRRESSHCRRRHRSSSLSSSERHSRPRREPRHKRETHQQQQQQQEEQQQHQKQRQLLSALDQQLEAYRCHRRGSKGDGTNDVSQQRPSLLSHGNAAASLLPSSRVVLYGVDLSVQPCHLNSMLEQLVGRRPLSVFRPAEELRQTLRDNAAARAENMPESMSTAPASGTAAEGCLHLRLHDVGGAGGVVVLELPQDGGVEAAVAVLDGACINGQRITAVVGG
ncbi:hypothetical protein DQ04_02531080 [Trypanosoma grayi]|uniref:hypothetical protein n=1 Tax=Trypanosoma grayi TaxID=71804 RepID=UPI0004F44BA7|nr:hypothetical protein DQ04_02531080 [Trypanosoma grayi]KEG11532.1 hypothetical protein DQ04_02531080 [Trypanosoma grayi]